MAKQPNYDGMWFNMSDSIANAFGSVSNTTGIVKDGTTLIREMLKPEIVDARADTIETTLDAVARLTKLGMSSEDAMSYLTTGRY